MKTIGPFQKTLEFLACRIYFPGFIFLLLLHLCAGGEQGHVEVKGQPARVSSLQHMSPRNRTQITGLGTKYLYQLNHSAGPPPSQEPPQFWEHQAVIQVLGDIYVPLQISRA